MGRAGEMEPAGGDAPLLAPALLALTATTGLVDAVSVIGLGRVFTANMTGNVVFLGFALAGAPGFALWPSLVALACFLAGAAAGGRTTGTLTALPPRRRLGVASAVEGALLACAALVVLRYAGRAGAVSGGVRYGVIALTAGVMGMRNAVVRRLAVPDLTTTVLTLTLAGLGADARRPGDAPRGWARKVASVAAMLAGAVAGGGLVTRYGLAPPLLGAAAVAWLVGLSCLLQAAWHRRPGVRG